MTHRSWLTAPRSLLILFLATGALLVSTLLWLGWQLARQDRELDTQRRQERRENAADLAVAALRRSLQQAEDRLATLVVLAATRPPVAFEREATAFGAALGADSVLIVSRPGDEGWAAFPSNRLPFYPEAAIREAHVAPGLFANADALEFRSGDHAGALAVLAPLARSGEPSIRAAALVRTAAVHRRQGKWDAALATYREVSALRDTPFEGVPAELVARHARLSILADRQRQADAREEASAILAGLRDRRWRLTRGAFEFYSAEAARALGDEAAAGAAVDPVSLALAHTVNNVDAELRPGPDAASRRLVRADNLPALLVVRTTTDAAAALVLGPAWVSAHVTTDGGAVAAGRGVALGVSEPDGQLVAGPPVSAPGSQALRLAATTGLPWNLHAVTIDPGATEATSTTRRRLIATGLGAVTVLFLAGIALIGRAVTRELAVSRQQSEFVSAVSHEFRTPLSSLCLLSELLEGGRVKDEAERAEYYGVLARESQRLRRLVDGLLNFGRMEAGAMHYRFETIDPVELARHVCREFQGDLGAGGHQIELETRDDTPLVSADRAALACALWNLVDNAVKYSPECRTMWVEVGREPDAGGAAPGRAIIRVRDRGIGIPAREQARIFEKFVRGRAAEQAGTVGTGVGLALVRHIVAAHGGEILMESTPGEGSAFTIALPAARA